MAMARHVDEVCMRFERAWNAGERPVIEEYLGDTSEPARSRLLSELVAVEVACRRRQGDKVQADEYQRRFPNLDSAFLAGLCQTPVSEAPGTRLGPYKLLQQLGEGGMGVVFLAEQAEPVRRQVALKVIKAGLDSARVLARFEQERQALALMDHPHIAKVLDAGSTPEGRPYFVMELVKGLPFTKYCDQEQLTPRERLELFIPVCQAVQHAHQKGIIHRDLKPSNVLIGLYDGKPVPKVIDFGVAKATGQRLTERTLFTEVGCLVGTLEYMAPEQAEVNNLDIDTRADIYSLGVLLYELLTGSPPFTGRQLRNMAYHEMLRVIREVEPPRPSTKLLSSAELVSIAARRKLEPKKLTKLVHGDLDWIVMKCLAKERSRRYETANGLARDLQRYFAGEPVEAGPPSAVYRLRKLAHKHRTLLATGTAFFFVLLVATVFSAWQAVLATRAKQDAKDDRDRALANEQKARDAADAERIAKEAEVSQRKQAEAVAELLESVFHGPNPYAVQDLKAQLLDRLGQMAADLENKYAGEPLTRARLRSALGVTQMGLGQYAKAVALFQQSLEARRPSLGPDHPDTLINMGRLGRAYHEAGQLDRALPLLEQTLEKQKAILGPDHTETVTCMSNLASAYQDAGQWGKALPLYEQALTERKKQLGPDHEETLKVMNNLAGAYHEAGRLDEALPLLEQSLDKHKTKLGPDHPGTLHAMYSLAMAYNDAGGREKALLLLEEALEGFKAKLGGDHPNTLTCMRALAKNYQRAGQADRAIPLLDQVLAKCNQQQGPDHPGTLRAMRDLADAYKAASKLDKALPLLEEALEKSKVKLGPDHPDRLSIMGSLALAYLDVGQTDKAVVLLQQELDQYKAKDPDHPNTLICMHNLASAYRIAGQLDKAVPLFEQLLKKQKAKFEPDHQNTLRMMTSLAVAYDQAKRSVEAEALFREVVAIQRRRLPADSPRLAGSLDDLGENLLRQKKYHDAERIAGEALQIREKKAPDNWLRFNTQSVVGACLLGRQDYVAAEPLLRQGYEGMKQHAAKIPAHSKVHLTEALERLVQLYEAWDKKDEAAKWRKKLNDAKTVGPTKP
jgi:serine/threonine protein kinase/tetratricopeptide (TPR) repeat protein